MKIHQTRSLIVFSTLLFFFVGVLSVTSVSYAQNNAMRTTLIENGSPRSVIIVSTDAVADEQLAAKELQQYLQKISGAEVETQNVAPADITSAVRAISAKKQVPILIGQAANSPDLIQRIRDRGSDLASFIVKVDADRIGVVGLSPEGTLFGVYELLEQLGVRWYMPGDMGTVVPTTKTVTLPVHDTVQVPSFPARWFAGGGKTYPEWNRHVRMGGPYFPPAHGLTGIQRSDFAKHPEYFAVIGGKRVARQLDVSNPEVVHVVTEAAKQYFRKNPNTQWIGMGPDDGSGFCECDRCRALDGGDWDPFSNEVSVTDRYIWFFNQVLDGIKDEFPGKKIAFYAYHSYMRPPVKTKPNPLITPALAPIALCRVHGMSNPVCPERSYYRFLMREWGKVLPEVYERGYWFNLADPGFPFSHVHRVRDEIPSAHELGIKGWRVEAFNHWGSETPSLYIAAKLMWNHNTDVDALLNDFYTRFFGPAQKPMAEYFTMMDAALRDADYHTGSSFDMPNFYPHALRDRARKRLEAAAQIAGGGIYSQRIKIFRSTFDYLEAFIAMQEHSSRHDFTAAHQSLNQLDAFQKSLIAHDPPLINAMLSPLYLKRFFRQPIEQGFARTRNGSELVAPLGDEWHFQIDQQKIGEDINLWKAQARGNNWQRIRTSTQSWGNQGLRTYKGEAWYRQEVDIPARFAGKRIFLWFGGVDETAKVWVNGQLLGISHGASFLPFELDATAAVKAGERNVVTVRVANEVVDELGTGGITGPVMFYAPAAGKDAKIENVIDLKPTFP